MSESLLEGGTPGAPTIVLLHGGGLGPWSWRPHLDRLAPEWHCLAPRLPGHGLDSGTPFTFERGVEAVSDLIRRRASGGVAHVAGLSLGGQLALALAARRPELVNRLVVSGANVRGIPGARFALACLRPLLGLKNLGFFGRMTARQLGIAPGERAAFLADARALTFDGLSAIVLESGGFRAPAVLAAFEHPVLLLAGAKEPKLIHRSMAELARLLPRSGAQTIAGRNHVWPLQDPRLFSDTVAAWCSDRPLPSFM